MNPHEHVATMPVQSHGALATATCTCKSRNPKPTMSILAIIVSPIVLCEFGYRGVRSSKRQTIATNIAGLLLGGVPCPGLPQKCLKEGAWLQLQNKYGI